MAKGQSKTRRVRCLFCKRLVPKDSIDPRFGICVDDVTNPEYLTDQILEKSERFYKVPTEQGRRTMLGGRYHLGRSRSKLMQKERSRKIR